MPEYGKLYIQAKAVDDIPTELIEETLEDGANVYLQVTGPVDIWMQVGNPDQSDYNQLKNITGKVIAFNHGKPTNGPPCPPGGCH